MQIQKTNSKAILILAISLLVIFQIIFIAASPDGPTNVNITSNRTKSTVSPATFNYSGGYLSTINMTAVTQTNRWKAFVGWVSGAFTLDDASGKTVYDWTLSSTTGQVYATRTSGSVTWASIGCASIANMDSENTAMSQSSSQDNITATFRKQAQTHSAFTVGGTTITANKCNGTLNTYVNDATQDTSFQEMVLYDTSNIVYATILENRIAGYDGSNYDFQMIVPENGTAGFSGKTPYYLYTELN